MAYVETTRPHSVTPSAARRPAKQSGPAWHPAVAAERGARMHYAQQMLLAAILAAGTILTVAGVMLLRIF